MKNHLYEDAEGKLHTCVLAYAGVEGRSTMFVYTKCGKDVPANQSFKSAETANCQKCTQE